MTPFLAWFSAPQAFMTFADTADAVAASTEMIDSKMGKSLKKFLTKNIIKKELKDKVEYALMPPYVCALCALALGADRVILAGPPACSLFVVVALCHGFFSSRQDVDSCTVFSCTAAGLIEIIL